VLRDAAIIYDFVLKKQRQEITFFKAEVEGNVQVGEAKPFKDIHVVF
jgi:putative redox protein